MTSNNKKLLAVIPARGGSKRIEKKNIVPFMGKPLIAWTIEAALKADCFDRVLVSTDDLEIAETAIAWGATAPFLRDRAADDNAPASEATIAAVRQCETCYGETYGDVVQLFAVCPLRDEHHIRAALAFYRERDTRFLISAHEFRWMNPWWACEVNERSEPRRIFPDAYVRSQDLPPLFAPTGAVWIADVDALKKAGTFYGPGHVYWIMDWKAAVDIDVPEDLALARALFHMKKNSEA